MVTPFCFDSNVQIRRESKAFLALLCQLTGPCYHPFLKLSPEEVKILRLCFENAATSDDHNVILKLESSTVRYSAFELAVEMSGLAEHRANRIAFADSKMFAAIFKMLVTGSTEEKVVSIQLMTKLVDVSETCSVLLDDQPALVEILQSLAENNDTLKHDVSKLIQKLNGIVSTNEVVPELNSAATGEDPALQREGELKHLLTWATREMSKSKVLHHAADEDSSEVVMALVFLISHLREMSCFRGSGSSVSIALRDCSKFLSILQDYTQRHFFSMLLSSSNIHRC